MKLLMKKKIFLLIIFFVLFLSPTKINGYDNGVENGDKIYFGYTLYVEDEDTEELKVIESYNENMPLTKIVSKENIRPLGLYKAIIGMEIGDIQNIVVYPSEGFQEDDENKWWLAGEILYYYELEIYKVIPKEEVSGNESSWLVVFLSVIGGVMGIGLLYLGWRVLKTKVLAKKCINCKKLAVGYCNKCEKPFCKDCYSGGCLICRGRKLIRYKN